MWRRIVSEKLVLRQRLHSINAKPVNAAIEPEAHGVADRRPNVRIAPVEIRLGGEKLVEVVLSRCRIKLPGRSTEHRGPVVRRSTRLRRIAPDKPISFRIVAR